MSRFQSLERDTFLCQSGQMWDGVNGRLARGVHFELSKVLTVKGMMDPRVDNRPSGVAAGRLHGSVSTTVRLGGLIVCDRSGRCPSDLGRGDGGFRSGRENFSAARCHGAKVLTL